MKKAIIIALSLATVLGLAACGGEQGAGANAGSRVLVVKNQSGVDLVELTVSASSSEDWEEENLIEGKTLQNGGSLEIPLSAFPKDEAYDLDFCTEENNHYFKMEVDVKNAGTLLITKEDGE